MTKKRKEKESPKKKYAKRFSFYPLKPEEVLAAFMKVSPKKVKVRERKEKQEL